jgi:hypothetical protein
MSEEFDLFVGIDWAAENHEVCVLDTERRVIDRKTIEHSGAGIAQLCDLLLKLSHHQRRGARSSKRWWKDSLRCLPLTRNRWIVFGIVIA